MLAFVVASMAGGCAHIGPIERPIIRNPFPQLTRVAIVPFNNLSTEPSVSGIEVAEAYQIELARVPGFEVVPVGVIAQRLRATGADQRPELVDYQALARDLGVDAIVLGAITDFSEYRPPRMGLTVRWYASDPAFHPILPGYGLPWNTADEEYIPEELRWQADFALAEVELRAASEAAKRASGLGQRTPPGGSDHVATDDGAIRRVAYDGGYYDSETGEQDVRPVATVAATGAVSQNPQAPARIDMGDIAGAEPLPPPLLARPARPDAPASEADGYEPLPAAPGARPSAPGPLVRTPSTAAPPAIVSDGPAPSRPGESPALATVAPGRVAPVVPAFSRSHVPEVFPSDDRRALWPRSAEEPPCPVPNRAPILTQSRHYDSASESFAKKATYYERFRDPDEPGNWRLMLASRQDFVRLCCHLDIAELLTVRGGAGQSSVAWRIPECR